MWYTSIFYTQVCEKSVSGWMWKYHLHIQVEIGEYIMKNKLKVLDIKKKVSESSKNVVIRKISLHSI